MLKFVGIDHNEENKMYDENISDIFCLCEWAYVFASKEEIKLISSHTS